MSASTNPVYVRLTRHAGWPSEPGAVRLRNAIGVIGLLLTLGALILSYALKADGLSVVPIAFTLTGVALALIGPLLAFMITTIGMARSVSEEDLELVLLSNLTPHEVVNGYYHGALHHLRVLWVIGAGLIPGIVVSELHLTLLQPAPPLNPAAIILAVLGVISTSVVVLAADSIAKLGVIVGVWLALRWRGQTSMIAIPGLMAAVISMTVLLFIWPWLMGMMLCLLGLPFLVLLVNQVAWRQAQRTVEAKGRGGERID